jgi:hypothetical protein
MVIKRAEPALHMQSSWNKRITTQIKLFKDNEMQAIFVAKKRWKLFLNRQISADCLTYRNSGIDTTIVNLFNFLR